MIRLKTRLPISMIHESIGNWPRISMIYESVGNRPLHIYDL